MPDAPPAITPGFSPGTPSAPIGLSDGSSIPQALRITGITSPAASDPIILARVADVDGFPHWEDSTGQWEMATDADGFALAKAASAYLAFVASAMQSPVGITGWTVGPGTGQPTVSAYLAPPAAVVSGFSPGSPSAPVGPTGSFSPASPSPAPSVTPPWWYEGEQGAVRYDIDQSSTLTDEEKEVARLNIGISRPTAAEGSQDIIRQLPRLLTKFNAAGLVNPSFLLVGDSVMEGKLAAVKDILIEKFGSIQSDASWNIAGAAAGGAALVTNAFTFWPTGEYYTIPAAGSVTYALSGVVQVLSNQAKLYYLKEAGAGTFKIQGSFNGGAYADVTGTINAANASTISAVESVTLPYGLNSIRVVGVSGTVKTLPICRYVRTGKAGAQVASIHKGGIDMSHFASTPAAILDPIVEDMAPDVILFEVKDTSAILTANLATALERVAGGLAYTPDVILIGTNNIPSGLGPDPADVSVQNAIMRQWAVDNNQTYLDFQTLFGETVAEAVAAGLQPDANVHPSALGYGAQVTRIFDAVDALTGGALHAYTRPRSLEVDHSPLTLENDPRAAVITAGRLREVGLAAAAFTNTATVCFASASDGNVYLATGGSAASGNFARATLAGKVNSGTGTGAGTRFNIPIGFSVRLVRILRANVTARIFIGAAGADTLGAAGIGIQINADDTAQILAHNGTTLTTGPAFAIGTFTEEIHLVIESDAAGNVYAYYALGGSNISRTPISMSTGGPTAAAASGSDKFVAGLAVTGAQSQTSEMQILSAKIFQGAILAI